MRKKKKEAMHECLYTSALSDNADQVPVRQLTVSQADF